MDKTLQCSRCSADNDSIRKYCHACGAPLGPICSQCGTVNRFEDQFCGICGMPVGNALNKPTAVLSMGSFAEPTDTRQYSAEDIKDLLIPRNAMKQDDRGAEILGQHDIDKLFE
jgi:predicted amidophosphoribosyltransferase